MSHSLLYIMVPSISNQSHNAGFPGCARFPQFVQNFSERQILWSLCSVDFHTFALQLPIQILHSVEPELLSFCEFT